MRKILHLNAGNETGGGMHHIVNLLQELKRAHCILGVFERGELLKRAQDAGIKTVYFPNKTRLSIPLLQALKKYIEEEEIDIVHTHGPRANVYMHFLRKFTRFHWVTTIHSDPVHDFSHKGMVGKLLTRFHINAMKHADQVIAISDRFKENLMDLGVKPERITTVLNGIDFNKKQAVKVRREDFGLRRDAFLFLQVARCEPVKGIDLALEAFAGVAKRRRDCYFMLVGDGSTLPALKRQARALGMWNRVFFLGYKENVEEFYELADVTLLSSYSESFPLVLLESARAKKPVITTNVGGVEKLVKNNHFGWKVKPGNVDQLEEAMTEAVDEARTQSLVPMGEQLFQHAETEFSLEIFAENVYNVYLDAKVENEANVFKIDHANHK